MKQITGSQAVMESLVREGVKIIFGYPGGAIMPIYDALFDYEDKISHVLCRHEQGAAHAAEGYARITGKPGVCFATSGPGATNLVTGIADAMMDSVPLICITGQVSSELLGTQAFQEVDIVSITKPVTKWNCQVKDAKDIPAAIVKGFQIARSGRPGPVLIDITKNAQFEKRPFVYKQLKKLPVPKPNKKALQQAADLLNTAQKPLMLLGHGVRIAGAEEEVCRLAGRAGIPVATTLHGLSSFQCKHDLYVGMLGMHGNYAPNKLTNEADVILAVGMRFDDRVTGKVATYAKQAKIIHIDISAHELNRLVKTTVAINADAKEALTKLNLLVKRNEHTAWLQEFRELEKEEVEVVQKKEVFPHTGELRMAEVVRLLSEKTKGNAIIVADVGQHQMAAARYFQFNKQNSFITSGGAGTMGYALPAAIGVKKANPQAEVIAIMGDGGAQMNIQELGTIMQEKLPVKIIILNNNHLGLVRQWQEMFFDKRYSFVDLKNPDFVQIANGYGITGTTVDTRENIDQAFQQLLQADKPYLLDIRVAKEENVFPMVPSNAGVGEVRLN